MDSEEVWEKFLPRKIRKGNYNSNLSQMSTTSLISKNGLLSLSTRKYQDSFRVASVQRESSITPPRPSTSKNTRATPKTRTPSSVQRESSITPPRPSTSKNTQATPKTRTPSTIGKSSSKSNIPSDGKTQRSLHSYFSISPDKKSDLLKLKVPEVVDITADSSSDEENSVLCERNKERSNERTTGVSSTVSRVLFHTSSTTTEKDFGEMLAVKHRSSSPIRGQDKENRIALTAAQPKSLMDIDKTTEDVSEPVAVFKEKVCGKLPIGDASLGDNSKTCITYQQDIGIPVAESEVPDFAVGPHITPPQVTMEVVTKKLENHPNFQDKFDKEWMTQEGEASKRYAIDQWKSLMKKMREGKKPLESNSGSTFSSSDIVSSSFISTSSQGTYSNKGHMGRGEYSQGRRSRVCPFYKKIKGTRFAVDAFSYGDIPGITHYFLSHFHYDHYMGLNKHFSYPIYCSSVTAKLVTLKLQVKPNLIKRIDPGQTIKVDGVTVTALDANHCPGSLMLLFQLPEGTTHLHVGDFRAHIGMESYPAFWNVHIEQLYLDTTYCNPTYTFSSQERAIDKVLSIVESAVDKAPTTLIVCGSYTIGKERVFAAITERFDYKVWAPPDKRKVLECVREGLQELYCIDKDSPANSEGGAARELSLIGALARLTMLKEDAQVHVLPMAKINEKCLKDHLFSIRNLPFTNVVAFRPTGWAHGRTKGAKESNLICNTNSVRIYEVAYSEHSSFQELERFVKFIKPGTVVKTVNVGSAHERAAMEKHINSWLSKAHSKKPVPNRSSDSPKSSQVAMKQREAGDFTPQKRKNSMERTLSVSNGRGFKLLASNNLQSSSERTHFTGSCLDTRQTEEWTSYPSQLQIGAKKRIISQHT